VGDSRGVPARNFIGSGWRFALVGGAAAACDVLLSFSRARF